MKSALIISGGKIEKSIAISVLNSNVYDIIVAVDGGLMFAKEIGIVPDVIIGDYDTAGTELLNQYRDNGSSRIITLNPAKDSTDTDEAFDFCIFSGIKKIDVIGGCGDRYDHTLSNFFILKKAYEAGVEAVIHTELSEIFIIKEGYTFHKNPEYKYYSFIQFDGPALGVTLKGFKYPLDRFDFDTNKTYRLGVSNEMIEDIASITIESGTVIAIVSREDK